MLALTAIIARVGAAGMLAFERDSDNPAALNSYGTPLWWTAPADPRGATLATFFIGRDAEDERGELAGQKSINELRAEIAALREEIRALAGRQR